MQWPAETLILIGVFLLTPLLGCQHSTDQLQRQVTQLQFSISGKTILSDTAENNELKLITISGVEIYYSRFFPINSNAEFANFVRKRKQLFLNLFEDDVDPYRGKINYRSHCLKKIELNSVEFISGPETNFSSCVVERSTISSPVAKRLWILCQSTGFEITVKSKGNLSPLIQCRFN